MFYWRERKTNDHQIFLYTDEVVSEEMLQKLMKDIGIRVNVFEIRRRECVPRKNSGKIDYGGNQDDI